MIVIVLAGSTLLAAVPAPAAAAFVDWLYMEPNEGGSSAGHVAIAFGGRTYAYQRSPEGTLVLERDATTHVSWRYAVLGNRAVHRSRIAVSDAVFARLRAGFNRRWLIERRQRELLARLRREARLLSALAAQARGEAPEPIAIEAAGYFVAAPVGGSKPEGASSSAGAAEAPTGGSEAFAGESGALAGRSAETGGRSPPLVALAEAVAARAGAGYVAERRAALAAALVDLAPAPRAPIAAFTADAYPAEGQRFVDRYTAALTGLVALDVLIRAPALDPTTVFTLPEPLAPAESAALARAAARLAARLARLAASPRPDFGFALLVGMARLGALERSLATGRLVVLDAFPPEARRLPRTALARAPAAAAGLRDDACARLAAVRRRFVAAAAPDERAYAALEDAANRCAELARGLAERRDVRIAADRLVPARPALRADLPPPRAPAATLAAAATAAAATARAADDASDALRRYDLVRRNCVTETFRTIDAVLGPEAAAALGGRIEAEGGGRFVPKLAERAVRRTWRVTETATTPAHRPSRVAALAAAGNPLAVRLRESNVLTSTVYRPSADDSTFLFFTDDVVALRPLLGGANLAVGAGASLLGLARAPFDGGAALGAGLRGVLWSLPELAFVNVRKGSFDYVARDDGEGRTRYRPTSLPSAMVEP